MTAPGSNGLGQGERYTRVYGANLGALRRRWQCALVPSSSHQHYCLHLVYSTGRQSPGSPCPREPGRSSEPERPVREQLESIYEARWSLTDGLILYPAVKPTICVARAPKRFNETNLVVSSL